MSDNEDRAREIIDLFFDRSNEWGKEFCPKLDGEIAAALSAAELRGRTEEWRTIESAPQDGTRLLLWDAKKDIAVSGRWHHEPGIDTPNAYEPAWSWWVSDEDIIMWDGGPDDIPTHWKLLEPPK